MLLFSDFTEKISDKGLPFVVVLDLLDLLYILLGDIRTKAFLIFSKLNFKKGKNGMGKRVSDRL